MWPKLPNSNLTGQLSRLLHDLISHFSKIHGKWLNFISITAFTLDFSFVIDGSKSIGKQ